MRNDNAKELFAPERRRYRPDLLCIITITYYPITYGPSMATKKYIKKKIRNVFSPHSLSLSLSVSLAFLNVARDSQDIFQKITYSHR